MAEEDKEKIVFILKWRAYTYNVMHFGLSNAITTFEKGSHQDLQQVPKWIHVGFPWWFKCIW